LAASSICRRWVNPDVTCRTEAALQARVIALLFAIPPFAALSLLANQGFGLAAGKLASIAALSFALPLVAAAMLCLSGTKQIRDLTVAAAAPLGLLGLQGGQFDATPAWYLLVAICAAEGLREPMARRAWVASAALMTVLAVVGKSISDVAGLPVNSFMAMAPVALAAVAYGLSLGKAEMKAEPVAEAPVVASPASFEQIDQLVSASGSLVLQTSRNGLVSKVGCNVDGMLSLSVNDVGNRGFVERLHVADKVAFLAWLDDADATPPDSIRIRSGRTSGHGVPHWTHAAVTKLAVGNDMLVMITPATEAQASASFNSNTFAVVSHELRTPLNAIVGFSDMLRQEMFGPLGSERQREYLDLIHQSGSHMLSVINAILDFSRLENGSMNVSGKLFEPAEAAAFAIGVVSSHAQNKKIGLDFQPLSAFEQFSGDRRACVQILINLLSNAVKFTGSGGMVRLAIDVEDERLLMTVEDTGIGMDDDQRSQVCTPFYQAEGGAARSHEGMGLGLALVSQMAKLHGGSVEIESEVGRGTKVTVALAPIHARGANVTPLYPIANDESVRIIRVYEERENGTQRKTA
jgi:two-component system, cell cycle sensor histidine kinase DivJ